MKDEMIQNLQKELLAFQDHYVYLCDIMAVGEDVRNNERCNEKAPNFFRIVQSTCVDAMMMEFAKLYDDDKKAKTIPSLLDKCNVSLFQNPKKVDQKIKEFKNRMETDEYISSAISIIKNRRDKIFAHNDKKFFVSQEKDDSYLPTYKLWFLRNFTGEIIEFFMDELEIDSSRRYSTIYKKELSQLL